MLNAEFNSVGSVGQLLTVTLIFIFVLVLTYFVTRFAGTYKKQQMLGKNIQILETMPLSSSKYLQIVKAGEQFFLIAISKDQVSLIGELHGEQLDFSESNSSGTSFQMILDKVRKPKTEMKNKYTLMGDVICHQREKLPIYSNVF